MKHLVDADGVSRRSFLYERHEDSFAPSLAIALLEAYQESMAGVMTAQAEVVADVVSDIDASFLLSPDQFDQDHPSSINWPGLTRPDNAGNNDARKSAASTLTTLSFAALMADDGRLLDTLQNKILLVGYTATGIVGDAEDPLRTPFERRIPTSGVYLHAAILDNLLNDRFLAQLPAGWSLGLIMLSGIGSSLLLKSLGLRGRLVFLLGLLPLWSGVAYVSFLTGLWLPVAAPVGTALMGMLASQLLEQQERQALMNLFAINLSPQLADFVWQHKQELLTEGHIRAQELTATLLFSDIRDFTSIAETLSSEVLMRWLNRYFEVMTDCIMAHGGVVDKYIGDAIMAAFGAPVSRQGEAIQADATAAIAASLMMVERLAELNQEFIEQGLPTIKFGIGLHTGPLVAGTVGSRSRANYSLFGDTVNTAARLQEMTKKLAQDSPYPILVSDTTYQQVENRYPMLPQGLVTLRGRHQATAVYSPVPMTHLTVNNFLTTDDGDDVPKSLVIG